MDELRNDSVMIDDIPEAKTEKARSVDHATMEDKGKSKVNEPLLKTIPWPPPFLPKGYERLKRKGKYQKFLSIVKELSVNIPLVEALEKMPCYTMFKKDLVTKKKTLNFEPINNVHHCNVAASNLLVDKKEHPELSLFHALLVPSNLL